MPKTFCILLLVLRKFKTNTVLRQAWVENVRPILVLNKIDRLITELKLTPMEAHTHLIQILEQVNAIMGTFYAGAMLEEETRRHEATQVCCWLMTFCV